MRKRSKKLYILILLFYAFHLTLSHANPFQNSLLCIPEQGSMHIDLVIESGNISHDVYCDLSSVGQAADEINEKNSCTSVQWHHSDDNDWTLGKNRHSVLILPVWVKLMLTDTWIDQISAPILQYTKQNEIQSRNIILKKTTTLLI
ncbi:MAG: hypothetical protein Kow00108_06990 [Calditrichia bacterium]